MNDTTYQKKVMHFIQSNNLDMAITYRALDLASEVGEMAKEICEQSAYGQNTFRPNEKLAEELGDVFFSLCALANKCNIDLDHALDAALSKYRKRLQSKGHTSSG